ncbi:Lsr2 family protein [Streptomyces sp. NBC_00012]|uniref:Lsr2 family DNA-binding protein n=1 Tax=unclassified Streptomyces TaxID=2593676 RepID=UPI003252220F
MTAFAALTRLCPPPQEPRRRPIDWRQVEDVLGVRLPEDYKQLASAYGPGAFADYVCIYQPDGVTEWVDLTGPMRVPRLRSERGDDRAPVPQGHPRADDGLLPLGPTLWAAPQAPTRPPVDSETIREWARANGHQVSSSGRIPAAIREAWESARS